MPSEFIEYRHKPIPPRSRWIKGPLYFVSPDNRHMQTFLIYAAGRKNCKKYICWPGFLFGGVLHTIQSDIEYSVDALERDYITAIEASRLTST